MRVLHVATNERQGVSLEASWRLMDAIDHLHHESTLVSLTDSHLVPQPLDRFVAIASTTGRASLRARVRDVDVTVAHGPVAGEAVVRAVRRGTPFVYREVDDSRFWPGRVPPPKRMPDYLRKAAAVVMLSSGARSDVIESLRLDGSKVHVIPSGVSADPFHPVTTDGRAHARRDLGLPVDGLVAMTIGDLLPHKGLDVAIRAVLDLDGVTLVIAGDGPERDRLQRLVEGLAPPDRVAFVGSVEDRMRAYAAADAIVHPSTTGESFPETLLEAGFCGLPVVATPIGSVDSIVLDGHTGLLVPTGDVAGLRAALEVLRVARIGREAMGESARAHCLSRFEIGVVAKEWVEVLTRVVGEHGRR